MITSSRDARARARPRCVGLTCPPPPPPPPSDGWTDAVGVRSIECARLPRCRVKISAMTPAVRLLHLVSSRRDAGRAPAPHIFLLPITSWRVNDESAPGGMNIACDKVASRLRYEERRAGIAGRRKWINPPPVYKWINRRFVARPASHLLFTECSYPLSSPGLPRRRPSPPPSSSSSHRHRRRDDVCFARDLYPTRQGDVLNERKGGRREGRSDFRARYSPRRTVRLTPRGARVDPATPGHL